MRVKRDREESGRGARGVAESSRGPEPGYAGLRAERTGRGGADAVLTQDAVELGGVGRAGAACLKAPCAACPARGSGLATCTSNKSVYVYIMVEIAKKGVPPILLNGRYAFVARTRQPDPSMPERARCEARPGQAISRPRRRAASTS